MMMLVIGVLVIAVIWLAVAQWELFDRHRNLVGQMSAVKVLVDMQQDDIRATNKLIGVTNQSYAKQADLDERLTALENAQGVVINGTLEYLSPALAAEPKKVYHKDNKGRFAKKPA